MKKAWVENNIIREVATDPTNQFVAEIAANFSVEVDDAVKVGDTWDGSAWVAPALVVAEPATTFPKVSPVQFKLLFTGPERIAIKATRATDPLIDDFYDIIEDPRLTEVDLGLQSTQDGIGYLAQQGLIAPERVAEILTGEII